MGMDLLTDNPIFVRELRRRMRGRGLIVTLCLYIAAMCLVALLTVHWKSGEVASQGFGVRNQAVRLGGPSYTTATTIGRSLYSSIVAIQAILVLIVAPTITAAMVRSEKERQTFDFLRGTAISAPTYVVGALLSTVLYVALALFCALPVLMVSHLYGGVSDLVRTTFSLLGLSVVLSSGGLLASCATERGRTGHVPLALLLTAGLLALYAGMPGSGGATGWLTGAGVPSGTGLILFGTSIPLWVVAALVCVSVSGVMLLVASRKLFQPEERALNYRQMAVLYWGGVLLAGGWLYAGKLLTAAQAAGGSANPTLLPERVDLLAVVLVGLGITVQCTALLSRVVIGNDRWRLKTDRPALRDRDEASLFVTVVTAVALLLGAGILTAVFPGEWGKLALLLPIILFLAAHAGLCRFLMKRKEDDFSTLRLMLVADIVLLLVPGVLAGVLRGSGTSQVPVLLEMFSPIETAHEIFVSGLSLPGLSGTLVQAALAAAVWGLSAVTAAAGRQRN